MNDATLNEEQKRALDAMRSGANVFLSGGAGTGKSYVIRKFINESEAILACAPTGMAALHIKGVTVHSLFGLNPDSIEFILKESKEHQLTRDQYERHMLRSDYVKTADALKSCKAVVIDEISMVRQDVFDCVCLILQAIEQFENRHIQLITCGDFYQLPPVIDYRTSKAWYEKYPYNLNGYAFLSPSWKKCHFYPVLLSTIMRQDNETFAKNLNQIRVGINDSNQVEIANSIGWINSHRSSVRPEHAIVLCARKKSANGNNNVGLASLPDKSIIIKMTWNGDVQDKDLCTERDLELKKGARIMFVVNDTVGRYRNGTFGKIVDFHADEKGNVLEIMVKIDGEEEPIPVRPYTWNIRNYRVEKSRYGYSHIVHSDVGWYRQFPLLLAWAITIHKSQGQTYDKVILETRNIEAPGLAYTAISRVTSIKGLYLEGGPLLTAHIHISPEVRKFYQELESKTTKCTEKDTHFTDITSALSLKFTGAGPSHSLDSGCQNTEPVTTHSGQPLLFYTDGLYHTFTPNNTKDAPIRFRIPNSRDIFSVNDEHWSVREIHTDDPTFTLWEFKEMAGSCEKTRAYYLIGERKGQFYSYVTTRHLAAYGFQDSFYLSSRVENGVLMIDLDYSYPSEGESSPHQKTASAQTVIAYWNEAARWIALSAY